MGKFNFLTRFARNEGDYVNALTLLPTHTIDPGLFPQEELVHMAQQGLRVRDGRPVAELTESIEKRQSEILRIPARKKRMTGYDKIGNSPKEKMREGALARGDRNIPVSEETKEPDDWKEIFWQTEKNEVNRAES